MRFLLLLVSFIAALNLNAQSADTREGRHALNTAANSPARLFESRLDRLNVAIRENDTPNMISLQSDLLLGIREAMETATPEVKTRLADALEQFEGFSFHEATPAEKARKFKTLADVLPLIN